MATNDQEPSEYHSKIALDAMPQGGLVRRMEPPTSLRESIQRSETYIIPSNTFRYLYDRARNPALLAPLQGNIGVAVVPRIPGKNNVRLVGSFAPNPAKASDCIRFLHNSRRYMGPSIAHLFVPRTRADTNPANSEAAFAARSVRNYLQGDLRALVVEREYAAGPGVAPEYQTVTVFYPNVVHASSVAVRGSAHRGRERA